MFRTTEGAPAPLTPPAEPADAAIIVRSRDEPEQFALLFRRHAPELHRYIVRRLGPDAAEDVLSEVFLVAFRQRDRYDVARPDARPWLYGITSNMVGRHRRDEVRALRAFQRTGVDPVMQSFTERSDAQEDAAAVSRDLAAALAGLRAVYRDALLLVAWGELTYEEAACALDVPVGTVRSRINRARTKMRAALGGVDPTAFQEEIRHA
ncbi:RNA polymerase sigma factor [Actinoplanes sp. NPDC051859]|uniref:RNA polymerase sigma factor n=1 Tax=Actinoplanes sp. NPDC051859 TaxID=3363909 RepID=UPI0037B26ADE